MFYLLKLDKTFTKTHSACPLPIWWLGAGQLVPAVLLPLARAGGLVTRDVLAVVAGSPAQEPPFRLPVLVVRSLDRQRLQWLGPPVFVV